VRQGSRWEVGARQNQELKKEKEIIGKKKGGRKKSAVEEKRTLQLLRPANSWRRDEVITSRLCLFEKDGCELNDISQGNLEI